LLLGQQLENSIRENHEYKRIIDTLYDKNITLKKKLFSDEDVDKVHMQYLTLFEAPSKMNRF
jgi:hypothetical protein